MRAFIDSFNKEALLKILCNNTPNTVKENLDLWILSYFLNYAGKRSYPVSKTVEEVKEKKMSN